MSDKIISKINEGWLMLFCIVPFAICGYILNDVFVNIAISVFWTIAVICYIIRILIDCGYGIKGFKDYEISQGTINLLAIQYTTLSIVEIKYHIFASLWHSSGIFLRVILFFAGLLFLIVNVAVWLGFVVKKKNKQNNIIIPEYNAQDIPKDATCVLTALDSFEDVINEHMAEMERLSNLTIPVPNKSSELNKAPLVDYIQTLSDLPNSHSEFAAFEQFALMVVDKSRLNDFGEELSHSLGEIVKDGYDYAGGLKELLIETKNSFGDYISNRSEETTHAILKNFRRCLQHDIHSAKFHYDFDHAKGVWGKLGTVFKHITSDFGKGTFKTFFNEDDMRGLNEVFGSKFEEHMEDIASSLSTDIDIDVWDPDYNAEAHFPMISTAVELCRLGIKYTDGDVDMEKAFTKSGTKIGMTAGGAWIGAAIGSLLPGAGTVVGAMIGGWLGRLGANKINKAETKRLQGELEEQIKRFEMRVEDAKHNIVQYQSQTIENITYVAYQERDNFEELKQESPLACYAKNTMLQAVLIIEKDYLEQFINDVENQYETNDEDISKLRSFLPSAEQIKNYPQECLELILSSQKYIRNHFKEDYRYNAELINEICISSVLQKICLTKTLQALWYNQVFNDYKTAVANVMQKTNDYIKDYVDKVGVEKQAIDKEVAIAEEIKRKLEMEMKTN